MRTLWDIYDGRAPDAHARHSERIYWFDKIAPKDNWKNPIDAWIDAVDFAECNQACIWFTGASLEVVERRVGETDRMHVQSPGYYWVIGA